MDFPFLIQPTGFEVIFTILIYEKPKKVISLWGFAGIGIVIDQRILLLIWKLIKYSYMLLNYVGRTKLCPTVEGVENTNCLFVEMEFGGVAERLKEEAI